MTWAQFKAGVLAADYKVNATQLAYAAVAAYVKALIVREIDGDILLHKSYMNSYDQLKAKLAGSVITANFAAVKAEVLTRITVDANRTAIASFIDKAIQEAMDDINDAAAAWEQTLVEGMVDIQRHVVCFTLNQENIYLKANVTNQGFVAKIVPPSNSYVTMVTYERYAPDLTQGVNYAANDYVLSNMRIYKVTAGGVMGAVGAGLQTKDGSSEVLGGLTFQFTYTFDSRNCEALPWADRLSLLNNTEFGAGPYYTISPRADEMWISPMLDSTNFRIRVNWNGIKKTFADGDTVTFDESCYPAGVEWTRAKVLKNMLGDERGAAGAFAFYQSDLRKLWVDCNDRTNSS